MRRLSFLWLSPALTALGKKLGIDAHYFAKNSVLVIMGHSISVLRGLVTGYLVVRMFPKEMYGTYQFILSVMGALALFGIPGLPNSISRAAAQGKGFTVRGILRRQLPICFLGSLLLFGAIPFLGQFNREALWPLFTVAALLFPLPHIAAAIFGGPIIGKARFDVALKVNTIWSTLMIVATLCILFFRPSATLLLIAFLILPGVTQLSFARKIMEKNAGNENDKEIMRYGWQLTFATLPVNMVWYLDKLLIAAFFGFNQLATFAVALLIPEQAKYLFKELFPICFSRQAKGIDSVERRLKMRRMVLIVTFFFAIGIALYVLICPWLIPLLFPNYQASEIVLLTSIAAITLIVTPSTLFPQYLEAQGMIQQLQRSHWAAAILFTIALIMLVPTYGVLGAIIARGIFRLTYAGYAGISLWRTPIVSV